MKVAVHELVVRKIHHLQIELQHQVATQDHHQSKLIGEKFVNY